MLVIAKMTGIFKHLATPLHSYRRTYQRKLIGFCFHKEKTEYFISRMPRVRLLHSTIDVVQTHFASGKFARLSKFRWMLQLFGFIQSCVHPACAKKCQCLFTYYSCTGIANKEISLNASTHCPSEMEIFRKIAIPLGSLCAFSRRNNEKMKDTTIYIDHWLYRKQCWAASDYM